MRHHGRARIAFASLLLLFVALVFGQGACGGGSGSTPNGDDAGATGDAPAGTFSVGGTVSGLEGTSVQLALQGGETVTVSTDGAFKFTKGLSPGDDYAVVVGMIPQGHVCSIAKASGKVAQADVTDITVTCPSTDSALTSLSLSEGALAPAFAPAMTMYTMSLIVPLIAAQKMITLSATPRSLGAHLEFKGAPLAAATPSAPFPINPGPKPLSVVVTAADGASKTTYTLVVSGTPGSQEAYVKSSNTAVAQSFGESVSLSGDTLAVGAVLEASNATGINGNQTDASVSNAGAVYVFVRSGSTWTQQAYIKASNTKADQLFGRSVSLSGDTLAVGAVFETSNATGINGNQADTSAVDAGATYVFVRSGTTWTQQAYIKASNTNANQFFGLSVSLSGDTLAVGAMREASNATGVNGNQADTSADYAGAVYVFVRSGTTWTQQAYVKASNTQGNQEFGFSVSLSGDTLAVGAYGEGSNSTGVNGNQADTSSASAGAVYVFVRSATTWTQQAYVKASNTKASQNFGRSVSLAADTLAVGATGEASNASGINGNQADTSTAGAGAAYVFVRSGTAWTQQAYVKPSNTKAALNFGISVFLVGDTLAVGTQEEASNATGINGNQANSSAARAGAVYVFVRAGTTWAQQAYVKASTTKANQGFGCAVSLSGDTLAVGASGEASNATGINGNQSDTSAAGAGAVYVFR